MKRFFIQSARVTQVEHKFLTFRFKLVNKFSKFLTLKFRTGYGIKANKAIFKSHHETSWLTCLFFYGFKKTQHVVR